MILGRSEASNAVTKTILFDKKEFILYIFSQKQLKFILEGVLIIAYVSNLNLMLDCDFLRLRISYPFENIAEMSIQKC